MPLQISDNPAAEASGKPISGPVQKRTGTRTNTRTPTELKLRK